MTKKGKKKQSRNDESYYGDGGYVDYVQDPAQTHHGNQFPATFPFAPPGLSRTLPLNQSGMMGGGAMYGPMGGLMPNVFPAGNIGPPHPSVPMPLMPNMVMPYQLPAMPPPPADYRPEEIDSSVQGALASLSAIFPALQHPTPVVLVRMLLLERVKEKRPHTAFRNVVDGLRWITATADVAAQAKAKLLELREGYLAGEPLHPLPGVLIQDVPLWHPALVPLPSEMVSSAAESIASAGLASLEPNLATSAPEGGWLDLKVPSGSLKGSSSAQVMQPPPALAYFMAGDGPKKLVASALKRLDTACCMIGDGRGGLAGLALSGDIDFGVQRVVVPSGEDLTLVARAVAQSPGGLLDAMLLMGALPSMHARANGTARMNAHAHAHAGNGVLGSNGDTAGEPGSGSASANGALSAVERGGVLKLAPLAVRNTSRDTTFWVLGGVAAPNLPHTFAALDDARIFWAEGRTAVCLGPGQRHEITVAMSRASGPGRAAECGILQQALLLFIAVPWGAAAFSQLPRVQGAEFFEAYPPGGPSNNTPPFRVFIAARRVSVALLTTEHALAASVLDPTAKPFVSDHLKHVFDAPPTSFLCEVPKTALSTLGADLAARAVPACAKIGQAQLNSGVVDMAVAECRGVPAPTLCTVRKFARLLQLEESTMECDIKRHDMHGVRLFFALFSEPNPRVYHKAWLAGSDGEAGEPVTYGDEWPRAGQEGEGHAAGGEASNSQGTSRQRFRGPSLAEIQPGGVFDAGGRPAYALLMINVPGLPEGRPALTIGDWVHLRNGTNPLQEVVAVVASTERSTAFLLPANSFWTAELKEALACSPQGGAVHCKEFDPFTSVRFAFDRRPLMHMRGALIATASMAHSARLLPSLDGSDATDPGMQPVLADVTSLAETLPCMSRSGERLNAEQRLAVAAVVLGAGRPSPYAVWGPPGTGKTVTLVACALELRRRYPGCRLLCCAPQNYSADLLCSALAGAGVGGGEMIRLNDPRRPPYTVKDDVMSFCSMDDATFMFSVPPHAQLATKSIVVATCAAAALLMGGPHGEGLTFTHVLIDEAGQALLPEALLPVTLLRPPLGGVLDPGWGAVVCGDPKQLGPVVRSPVAAAAGLSCSLLEHLVSAHSAASTVALGAGRAPATSMLLRNYRSHSTLLDLPSKMFYQGALLAAADQASVLPPQWSELSRAEQPATPEGLSPRAELDSEEGKVEESENSGEVTDPSQLSASLLFYGVRGEQVRDADAPSYCNPLEASTVAELVEGLLESGAGVTKGDIGVMATYRKQVQLIRTMLRHKGLAAVRVGTVDDYQGQEERIIFISTVLTHASSLPESSSDLNAQVALWRNPRRFNVAVSRAKALLAVVGHPAVLVEDPCWKELVRHCVVHGTFRGAGAAAVRSLVGVREAPGGPMSTPSMQLEGGNGEGDGRADSGDLSATIEQLAELALLGLGNAHRLFPETLEQEYEAYAEETEWRVML